MSGMENNILSVAIDPSFVSVSPFVLSSVNKKNVIIDVWLMVSVKKLSTFALSLLLLCHVASKNAVLVSVYITLLIIYSQSVKLIPLRKHVPDTIE